MFLTNNRVQLIGDVVVGPEFSHMAGGHKMYHIQIKVCRSSGQSDLLPVHIPEFMLKEYDTDLTEQTVQIAGEYRSRNLHEESGSHLLLAVHAYGLRPFQGPIDCADNNRIRLQGYLCKSPIYRFTPAGERDHGFARGRTP